MCVHIYAHMEDTAPHLPVLTPCGPHPGSHKAQTENGLRFQNSRVATDASILKGLEVFTLSRGVGMS